MQDNEQNIDDLLRDALINYEERPRPEVWHALQGRLAESKDKNRTKPFPLRWWWVMGSLLLIVATGIIVTSKFSNSNDTEHASLTNKRFINKAENIERTNNLLDEGKHTPQKLLLENVVEDNKTNDNSIKTEISINGNNTAIAPNNITPVQPSPTNQKEHASNYKATSTEVVDIIQAGGSGNTYNTSLPTAIIANEQADSAPQPSVQQLKISGKISNSIDVITNKTSPIQQVLLFGLLQRNIPDTEKIVDAEEPLRMETILSSKVTESRDANFSNIDTEIKVNSQNSVKQSPATRQENAIPTISKQNEIPVKTGISKNTIQDAQPVRDVELRDFNKGFANRLALGVKAGYQSSFNSQNNASKWLLASFLQYDLSGKFSIILQPAFHSGKAKVAVKGTDKVYYNITSSSLDTTELIREANIIREPDTIYTTYVHTETYDSIRISTLVNDKKLLDVEVPLIVKYTILPGISITAGGVCSYSKAVVISETRKDYKGLQNSYTENFEQLHEFNQPVPVPPQPEATENLFNYSGEDISNYRPSVPGNIQYFFRWGYTVGIATELKKRLLLDISMQHMLTAGPSITDVNIGKIYTQPSFRFTVGYKLKN